jgi:hypothetical protein
MHRTFLCIAALALLPACSGAETASSSAAATPQSLQSKFDAIAKKTGCATNTLPAIPSPCVAATMAFLECVDSDPKHCVCEADDRSLNCEGAFKAKEGPAKCVAQNEAAQACIRSASAADGGAK